MRHGIVRLAALAVLAVGAVAQQAPIEPDIADVVWRLIEGKLSPLERQGTGTVRGKAGFGSMKLAAQLPGAKSPVRIRAGESLELIVRSPLASTTDPATIYTLSALDVKKSTRELAMMVARGSLFSATTKTGAALDKNVPVEFSRHGESSLKLTVKPLPPGEYAVGRMGAQVVFCFGIDK